MEKTNFKPLLAFLILLLGFLGWRFFGEKIFPEKGGYLNRLGIKREAVKTILLTQKNSNLELKKEGEIWRVKNKKAKEIEVNNLLNVLFPNSEPPLVAKTPARHKEMSVDEEKAIKVRINGDKEVWLGSGEGGNYLRFPAGDEVWAAGENYFTPILDFSFWADKTIILADFAKLKKIDWRSPPKIRVYEKREGSWWEGEKKIEDKILEPVISALSPLTADEVVEKERPAGYLPAPTMTLELEWEEGKEKLEFFKGGKNWLVKRNSDGEEFLISPEKIKNLSL